MIETQKQHAAGRSDCRPSRSQAVREQLMKREVAALVDRKLLYRRVSPQRAGRRTCRGSKRICCSRSRRSEMPELMKQLKVDNQQRFGARAGAAGLVAGRRAAGVQRTSDRQRMDPLEGEDQRRSQPGRDAGVLSSRIWRTTTIPTQARWEELMVRKEPVRGSRARRTPSWRSMGNEVWQRGTAAAGARAGVRRSGEGEVRRLHRQGRRRARLDDEGRAAMRRRSTKRCLRCKWAR